MLVGRSEVDGAGRELLEQLEFAIGRGDHGMAARLARDLAKIKISSRLTEQEDTQKEVGVGRQEKGVAKIIKWVEPVAFVLTH